MDAGLNIGDGYKPIRKGPPSLGSVLEKVPFFCGFLPEPEWKGRIQPAGWGQPVIKNPRNITKRGKENAK